MSPIPHACLSKELPVAAQPDVPHTPAWRWRTALAWTDKGLLTLGVLVVMGGVFLVHTFSGKLIMVTLGILIVEAGIGRLAYRHFVRQRQYLTLRAEVDRFLTYVRQLNRAALMVQAEDTPDTRRTVEHMRQTLHASVERMVAVAGQTGPDHAGTGEAEAVRDAVGAPSPTDEARTSP
jgi:hypothetical protein